MKIKTMLQEIIYTKEQYFSLLVNKENFKTEIQTYFNFKIPTWNIL